MKRLPPLCLGLLASASVWAQQAVLYTGSDWNDAEAPLREVWSGPAFAQAAGVTLATVDAPERVDDAQKAVWEKQKGIRLDPRRIPAFAWFDAKGRCVLLREGVEAPTAEAARKTLDRLVAEGRAREKQVADLLAKGTADAAGKALALLIPEIGLHRSREANGLKEAWDTLKAKDPEDATGWAFALTFDPASDACYKVQDFLKKKDIAGGEAYIAELNAKPKTHLSANQRQGLLLLRYILHRSDPAKTAEMDQLLRDTLALGADTHFGHAAQGLLCLRGLGPVAVPYGWFPKDTKAGTQTWKVTVGVAKTVRAPGRYALTLKREKGAGAMRVEAVEIGGKSFGPAAEIPAGGSAEIPFAWDGKADKTLSVTVTFAGPGKEERGRLALRPLLPERVARPDAPIDPNARPWAARAGEPAAAAYARLVLPEALLKEIVAQPGGAKFLSAFFGDTAWMEDFFGSGEPLRGWEAAFRALDAAAYHCPEILTSPVLKRWAAAAALNANADPTEAIRLLQVRLEYRKAGWLVRGADDLRCDQMRFTLIPEQCDADSTRWLAERHCVPPRLYDGVCWAAPYRLDNFFGDSIHGRDYYPPWDHVYIRHEIARTVGGVCGALSYYGSAAAKARGVPSTPGGQPGHCAYMLWSETEGRWVLAYNIAPYTGPHFSLWDGRGRFSYLDLAADLFARDGARESMRRLWTAETALAARPEEARHAYGPEQEGLYRAALAACPANLSAWRAYTAWLKGCRDVPTAAWEAFARAVAEGLNGHLEPAWELLGDSALPAIQKQGGKEALQRTLVALHGILRQSDRKTSEFCNYGRLLDEQAKSLDNDPKACFALFAADLPTQFGTADALGQLMRWGGARFLGNPELAPRYVAALNDLLKARGNEGNALGRYVRETIREASQAGNAEAFRSLCALQDALDPPKDRKPMDFSFAGQPLLSDRALLRLSTTSHWDHPEAYGHVLDGLTPTESFHTSEEKEPWVEAELAGMAEVSAVYLGNRPGQEGRLVPFVVEVSEDGKAWREVARDDKVRNEYRLTFAPVKAKHVRVRCQPKEKTFLHLRKFCVFGKKLY